MTFSKPLGTLAEMDPVATGPTKEPTPSRAWYQTSVAEFLAAEYGCCDGLAWG